MIHLYSPDNPRRPINWRYERARAIAEGGHPLSRKYDDSWVHKAYRFRQAFEACNTEADHALCVHKHPDIYWAHDIWNAISQGPMIQEPGNPLRSELEARLLADESYESIAIRLATSIPVIRAYERLFFNIEERRVNQGYIIHQVLGPAVYLGFQEQDYDILWKLVAIWGGSIALDMMIDGYIGGSRPTNPSDMTAWVSDATQSVLRRKALIAALTIRVNNYNAVELLAGFLKLIEIERAAGRVGAATETLQNNVDMMLKSLPIQIGPLVRHVDVPELEKYDTYEAELRCEEVAAIGLGQDIPARDILARFAFPPSPERPAEVLKLTEER